MRKVAKFSVIGVAVVIGLAVLFGLLLWAPPTRPSMLSLVARAVLWQRGYHLAGGRFAFANQTLTIEDVRINDDRGELFFAANRVTVVIDPAGLIGRSDRQLGLRSIALDEPRVVLRRRDDGSWNFTALRQRGAAPQAVAPAKPPLPWRAHIDIRRGDVEVVDPQAVVQMGKTFSLAAMSASAFLDQGSRSNGIAHAVIHTARGDAPLQAVFAQDDAIGLGRATIRVNDVPIAPIIDAFAPTTKFVMEGGLADVVLQAYSVGYARELPHGWHLSGDAAVRIARLRVIPLIVPVREVTCHLHYQDGLLSTRDLAGVTSGIPIRVIGAMRLLGGIRLALAVVQKGRLERERALFSFSQRRPVSGPFTAAVRVDGELSDVRVSGAFQTQDARYANALIRSLKGLMYFNDGHLTVSGLDLAYGGARLWVEGDFDMSSPLLQTQLLLQAGAPANEIPIAANLYPRGVVSTMAELEGPADALNGAGYAQLLDRSGGSLRTFFDGSPQAVTLGPLVYRASSGGDVLAGATISRQAGGPRSLSGELIASNVGLQVRGGRASLADVTGISVALPSLDTTLDGEAIVSSSSESATPLWPDVAINARAKHLVYSGMNLGDATLVAAGRSGRVHVNRATLHGARTDASAHGDIILTPRMTVAAGALQGNASADLSIFPGLRARGTTSGTFSAALADGGWIVGAHASSADASIAGVQVRDAAAVFDSANAKTSLIANVVAPRAALWAAGNFTAPGQPNSSSDQVVAGASSLDLADLRGFGLPKASGTAVGFATLRGGAASPDVNASAAVQSSFDNLPASFDLDVRYANGTLHSNASRVALLGNEATVNGAVSGLASTGALAAANMALDVRIREGDMSALNRFTGKDAPITGSYQADVRISGSGAAAHVDGRIISNLGTIRGVAFNQLQGMVHVRPGSVALERGSVELGSSKFELDGSASPHAFRVATTSPHVDMTDFNDFFGGADVLAGTGSFHVDLASENQGVAAGGSIVLDDAALRNYPLGHIVTDFSSRGGGLAAVVDQKGPAGAAVLSGTVYFPRHRSNLPDFANARYRLSARLRNVEVDEALALVHQADLGLTGKFDADGAMVGTLRKPIATATVVLHDGHLKRVAINSFSAQFTSDATGVTLKRGLLGLPFLDAQGESRFDFSHGRIRGRATVHSDDLASLARTLHAPGSLGGRATAEVSVSGTLDHPNASVAADVGRAVVYGITFDQGNIRASYSPGALNIGDTSLTFAGKRGRLSVTGNLPLQLRPLGLGPKDRPVNLTMRAEKMDLSVLNPLIAKYAELAGTLDAQASITGVAGNPLGKGTAQIRGASARSPLQAVPLTDASANLAFDQDTITLRGLHGRLGSGSIDASGSAHIVPAVGLRSNAGLQFASRLALHNAQLDVPNWIRGNFDGELSLTRSGVTPYVAGSLAISNAGIPFSAIAELASGGATVSQATPAQPPGVPPLSPGHVIVYGGGAWGKETRTLSSIGAPTPAATGLVLPNVDLNVAVNAGKDVRIRGGSSIDLTTTGSVVVAGNLQAPTLNGQFSAIRGQVGYFDTTFRLVSGTVTFDPTSGLLPTLDATAVTNVNDTRITLTISGRVDNLTTDLSSDPQMTRDQIVATLLHAPQISSLTGGGQAQATLVQTAQSYFNAQLSRSLLYPFESALAQELNVESISFILDRQGQLALEVRTRFTPTISALYQTTLYVPVTQSYGVSYRLRDYLALDFLQSAPEYGLSNAVMNLRYTFH